MGLNTKDDASNRVKLSPNQKTDTLFAKHSHPAVRVAVSYTFRVRSVIVEPDPFDCRRRAGAPWRRGQVELGHEGRNDESNTVEFPRLP